MKTFKSFIEEKYLIPAIKQHMSHYKKDIEKNSKSTKDKIVAHATHIGVMTAIGVGGAAAGMAATDGKFSPLITAAATGGILFDHGKQINNIRKKLKQIDSKK